MKRKSLLTIKLVLIALLLTSCSQAAEVAEPVVIQDLSDLSHIHSVATDGENIYAASHHGLYVWQGNKWKLRGDDFDIMGLSYDNGVFYASGHPGPLQNLPDPVGVLTSDDNGNTWEPLSLTGEVDFHLLEVVEKNFIGVAASHSSVLRSKDGGKSWAKVSTPNFTDLTVDPKNSNNLLLANGSGLEISNDFGNTFVQPEGPSGVTLVEWHSDYIFAGTKNKLHRSVDATGEFEEIAYQFDEIVDIHAEGDLVVVMDAAGIHISRDQGTSFELIARL